MDLFASDPSKVVKRLKTDVGKEINEDSSSPAASPDPRNAVSSIEEVQTNDATRPNDGAGFNVETLEELLWIAGGAGQHAGIRKIRSRPSDRASFSAEMLAELLWIADGAGQHAGIRKIRRSNGSTQAA